MNVLTLSQWENIWWGLIYFDQFIWIFFKFLKGEPFNTESRKQALRKELCPSLS